jgi:Type II secretion system (T2SS), protein E, N-terminal domain
VSTPLRERPDAPLGTLIFRAGLLPAETIESALEEGVKTGKRLGEILTERGLLKEVDLARLLAGQKGLDFVPVREHIVDPTAAALFTHDQARLFRALPYAFDEGVPVIAIPDPTDEVVLRNIREALGREEVRFVVSTRAEITEIVEDVYSKPLPEPEPVAAAPAPAPAPAEEPGFVTNPAPPVPQAAEAPPEALNGNGAGPLPAEPQAEPAAPAPAPSPVPALEVHAAESPEPLAPPPAAEEQPAPESPPAPEPELVLADVAPQPHEATAPEPVAPEAIAPEPVAPEPVAPQPEAAAGPTATEPEALEVVPAPVPDPEPAVPEPVSSPEPAPAPEPVQAPEEPAAPLPAPLPLPEPAAPSYPPAASAPEEVETPAPAADVAYEVTIRLTNGERVEAGAFAELAAAKECAKALMAQVAAAAQGEWPFVSGRFLKPDTIVSVDIGERAGGPPPS